MSEIPIKSLAERADARTSGLNLTSVYSGFLKRDMETLTPIRFVVYGKPRVLVKDVLIGRAYQSTLVKLQHCLLSNSDTMEAMRAVGIVCGSWANTGAAFRVVSSSLYRIWRWHRTYEPNV